MLEIVLVFAYGGDPFLAHFFQKINRHVTRMPVSRPNVISPIASQAWTESC